MKVERRVKASAKDLGFVASRLLSVLAIAHAGQMFVAVVLSQIATNGGMHQGGGDDSYYRSALWASAIGGLEALVIAFVGQQLWVKAGDFAAAREDAEGISLCAGDLLRGLLIGVGVLYAVRAIVDLLPIALSYFASIVSPGESYRVPAITSHDWPYGILDGMVAIAAFVWVARSANASRQEDAKEAEAQES